MTANSDHKKSPLGTNEGHKEVVSVREWWRIVAQRRWVVFAGIGVCVTVVLAHSLLATPQYRASATLQISPQVPSVLAAESVMAADPSYINANRNFYETQPLILKSRAVIEAAAERLDLDHRPDFVNRTGPPIRRMYGWAKSKFLGPPKATGITKEQVIGFIRAGLTVEPVRYSQLVEVSFVDRSPELARDVANAIAESYIQFDFSSWHDTTTLANEFLTKAVARIKGEIADLERQLQEYGAQEEILALSSGGEDLSERALGTLTRSHAEAVGRLVEAEANLAAVQQTPAHAIPQVINSPLINSLKQEFAKIERRQSQLSERFKTDWPLRLQAAEELRKAGERLDLEIENIARQVRDAALADHKRAKAELENIGQRLAEQKSEVQRVRGVAIEYAGLKASIDTKRSALNDLVARHSETDTSVRLKDSDKNNIRFVDRAQTPRGIHTPRKTRNLLVALLAGLCFGVTLALALDYLDSSVKNESPAFPCWATYPF